MTTEIVILNGARTAWAEYVGTPGFGAFKNTSAIDLCAIAGKEAIKKSGVKSEWIDNAVIGNASQTSGDALYGARHVVLKIGLPVETPALTINRLCGSGIEAVNMASRFLKLGEANFVLAGGMENMSQSPYVLRGVRGEGFKFGSMPVLEDALMVGLKDTYCGFYMAETAQNCAKKYGIDRRSQDEFALRSHTEGARAVKNGLFKEEIVSVPIKRKAEMVLFETDDHVKPDTNLEKLSRLPPSFGKDGTVTAGNASGIVDGAACLIVTTADKAKEKGIKYIGKVIDCVAVGVPPEIMGIGPAPAIKKLLEKTGLKLDQIDLFEINEAFAGQYLAVEKDLCLDRSKVNVNGGSIALGHPLAATGGRLILTLLYELRRRNKKYGIVSACIGGGQGIAMLLEAVK